MTRSLSLPAALALLLSAGAATAQTSAPPSPVPTPTRVRGTIDRLTGHDLVVTTRGGDKVSVTLADPFHVLAVTKAPLTDIKPGSGVGVASVPQPDGTLRALEVTLVPPGMPVTPMNADWDLAPSSRMTNGTVGTVAVANGRTLTVNYGKGELAIAVPDTAAIVTIAPADASLLVPGAHVVVFARKAADGALSAAAVAAGKDGLVPPM
jgi:hypothetical protein